MPIITNDTTIIASIEKLMRVRNDSEKLSDKAGHKSVVVNNRQKSTKAITIKKNQEGRNATNSNKRRIEKTRSAVLIPENKLKT